MAGALKLFSSLFIILYDFSEIINYTLTSINISSLKVLNLTYGKEYGDMCLNEIKNNVNREDTDALLYQHPETATVYYLSHKTPIEVQRVMEEIRLQLTYKYTFLYAMIASNELQTISPNNIYTPFDIFKKSIEQVDIRMLWEKVSTKNLSLNMFKNIMHANTPETEGHCNRLQQMASAIANIMSETHAITQEQQSLLGMGALLHDVGKILIPPNILNKPGKLTDEEFDIMKKHSNYGADFFKHEKVFEELYLIVKHHHERFDGRGYPNGIRLTELPITVAIVSFVDSVDAILSQRCYKEAKPVSYLLQEIERCSGTQFHPDVVEAFKAAYNLKRLDGILNIEAKEE